MGSHALAAKGTDQATSTAAQSSHSQRPTALTTPPELGPALGPASHLDQLQRLQHLANASPQVAQLQRLQALADSRAGQVSQLASAMPAQLNARAKWAKIKTKVEKSGEFNTAETRANTKAYAAKNPDKAEMVNSAGGAWLANQMNLKKKEERTRIGPTEAYMGAKGAANSAHAEHLEKFAAGGHSFITDWAHRKIRGVDTEWNFDGWGTDANFVGTPSAAQALVDEASKPHGYGLYYLEQSLGVADGNWVSSCEPIHYGIWRYHVRNPAALNIRMASGAESQAYSPWYDKANAFHEGEWVPKGQTLGGADEAVVDALPRDQFNAAVDNGSIEIELDNSMQVNTKREKEENLRPWKK